LFFFTSSKSVAARVIDTVPIIGCCHSEWAAAGLDCHSGHGQAACRKKNRQLPFSAIQWGLYRQTGCQL
jgi:hypothetical protein